MAQTASKYAMEKFIADIKSGQIPENLKYLEEKVSFWAKTYNYGIIDLFVMRTVCIPRDIVRLIGTYKHSEGTQLKLM